jgi:macrolide transport system ATP-binding/permease protein
VVLADEPTGALDTRTGDKVMDLFAELAAGGAAVVVVTHEPRVAAYADRVVTLRDGEKVSDTSSIARDPVEPRPTGPNPWSEEAGVVDHAVTELGADTSGAALR